jgi:pentatricopeptide repeat protein
MLNVGAWRILGGYLTRCPFMIWSLGLPCLEAMPCMARPRKPLDILKKMCQKGVEIDKITFISLLSACSHADLVDEGLHYFESLHLVYGISATVEHYVCIIDLLVQAGCLEEADDLINMMFCAPHAVVWMALLCACSMHGNVEMGEHIAKQVVELD